MRRFSVITITAAAAAIGTAFTLGADSAPRPAAVPPAVAKAAAPTDPHAAGGAAALQAFLKANCLECHGEKVKKADLALHTYTTDLSILKDRKVWDDVIEKVETGEMPPKKKPRPPAAEADAFVRNVRGVFDRAARTGKLDPGHVTVRRLNRTEYNNTIRDLMGVDFQPAEDFPSDDIGHGFDNIGDVLSLSPVLLERYLAAAESIVQRAITPDPPKPTVRRQGAAQLEPKLRGETTGRFRSLALKGNLSIPFELTNDGDYVLRTRVYAVRPDAEPARIALLADGDEVKTFEVTGTDKSLQVCEAKLALKPGKHRFAVAFINPSEQNDPDAKKTEDAKGVKKDGGAQKDEGADKKEDAGAPADPPKPRTLYVESIAVEGPSDMRPASQRRLLAADPKLSHPAQTRQALKRFLAAAYRRPPTAAEVERLAKVVEQSEAAGDKWEAGMQYAIQAVLVSPKFLFRVELDDRPAAPGAHKIDEYQLANRLSYFLWSTMPDDELFALAGKGQLSTHLDEQVRRMLKDPKATALVENFALQWLQIRRLKTFAPDNKLFPAFDESLRAAMLKETELFFTAVIQEDRSILDLIDADFTFLNGKLARLYGIADTNGNKIGQEPTKPRGKSISGEEFVRVSLADKSRGGVLTQASVLAVTSNPTRTSPVKRGKFVLEQILGTPPPPPPPDVPELAADDKAALSGSLRQRMEQHRADPACANCHARMDPIGFAFENFDAIGGYRAKDGEFAIDPSGTLPDGRQIKGPGDLKAVLRTKKDLFARCLTEKMLTYALGRGVEYYDKTTVDKIVADLDRGGYKFSALVADVVKSDPFRLRRGKEQAE